MELKDEFSKAAPSPNASAIFLDRHVPTGLFQGQNTERFWIVETAQGKRAITISDLYMPMFAVFTLSDERLDFGWALGKPILHLDSSIPSVDPTDVGIIGIDDFEVAIQCVKADGNTEWVVLGVYEPKELTGLFFDGWTVFGEGDRHPTAERNPQFYYEAEPFEPHFTVQCAERLDLVLNCTG
jgi:hypothetical protein